MTRKTKPRAEKSTQARPLTQKQEAFALAYFETGNAAEAYRRAYDVEETARDSWLYVEACQLLDDPRIAQRVTALREQAQELSIYTVLQASEEYEKARMLAEAEKNPSAMVSAITGKVKLFGLEPLRKHRLEHTGKDGGPIQAEEVSLRDRIASRLSRLATGGTAGDGADEDTGGSE